MNSRVLPSGSRLPSIVLHQCVGGIGTFDRTSVCERNVIGRLTLLIWLSMNIFIRHYGVREKCVLHITSNVNNTLDLFMNNFVLFIMSNIDLIRATLHCWCYSITILMLLHSSFKSSFFLILHNLDFSLRITFIHQYYCLWRKPANTSSYGSSKTFLPEWLDALNMT